MLAMTVRGLHLIRRSSAFWKWFACCDQNTGAGLVIPSEVKDEIVLLMLLMPLMHVDMRLQVSHLA